MRWEGTHNAEAEATPQQGMVAGSIRVVILPGCARPPEVPKVLKGCPGFVRGLSGACPGRGCFCSLGKKSKNFFERCRSGHLMLYGILWFFTAFRIYENNKVKKCFVPSPNPNFVYTRVKKKLFFGVEASQIKQSTKIDFSRNP